MISPHAIDACTDILEGREFYRESHGLIFRAIVALWARSIDVDGITVADELGRDGNLERAGGAERIHTLAALVPAASNARHWANIVRETWLARGLVRTGMELQRLGYERPGPIEELYAQGDKLMVELHGHLERRNDNVYTGKQLAEDFLRRLNAPDTEKRGLKAPFRSLSDLLGGRLHVLAGYQAHGKTSIGLQFLRSSCETGARVGLGSIEMSHADLVDRLVAQAGVPHHQIAQRSIGAEYQDRMNEALVEISSWDFEVIDDEALDPAGVRRHQRRGGYDILILDHLHRMPIRDRRHERQEIEDNVRQITNVAREFDIPVLLLAQLSRPDRSIGDPFPRPTTASLKGTGAIEQEASHVWFIWRKSDKQGQLSSEAELITAKNRFGPVGWQPLGFIGTQVRFTEEVNA